MKTRILLALLVVLIAYVALGGLCFYYLERDYQNPEAIRPDLKEKINDIKNSSRLTLTQKDIVDEMLRDYYERMLEDSRPKRFDMVSSMTFVVTAVTTIGYGDHVPKSPWGRVYVMILSLIGIPLFLVTAGGVGFKLNHALDRGIHRVICKFCQKYPKTKEFCISGLSLLAFFVCCLLVPAAIFSRMEAWSYGAAFYYCFVTLTTIGFGDYVAGYGDNNGNDNDISVQMVFYHISVALYILVGLAWMASLISHGTAVYCEIIDKLAAKVEDEIHSLSIKEGDSIEDKKRGCSTQSLTRLSEDEEKG